jgi:hypothetical protein
VRVRVKVWIRVSIKSSPSFSHPLNYITFSSKKKEK